MQRKNSLFDDQGQKMKPSALLALKIALLYAVIGALWILFSDAFVERLVTNAVMLTYLQTLKGWGYVALTAVGLYLVIRRSIHQLTRLSCYSRLTDLPNRQALEEGLHEEISTYRNGEGTLLMLLLDLDDFQSVNDSAGYYGGDNLLRECADLLRQVLPESGHLYHFGADKFVILIKVAALEEGHVVARTIADRIAADLHIPGSDRHRLSTSIGIASYPLDAADGVELFKCADAALQEAKLARGEIRFYHQELHRRHLRMLQLTREVTASSQEPEQFRVNYQPQYELRTGRVIGVEALVRWNHATHGEISPSEFIPVAERSGAIFAITRSVIDTSIRELNAGGLLGAGGLSLSINISEKLLGSKLGCDRLEEMLEPHAAFFPSLVLEITETAAMENVEAGAEMMQRLCKRGVRFSIDDFGTGFSSLLKLKQLPIHELKIDRSFVDELPDNRDDLAIVRTTLLMARELGIQVVAEGIEQARQHQCLLEHGCQLGQGYFLARPMSADALIDFCHRDVCV